MLSKEIAHPRIYPPREVGLTWAQLRRNDKRTLDIIGKVNRDRRVNGHGIAASVAAGVVLGLACYTVGKEVIPLVQAVLDSWIASDNEHLRQISNMYRSNR